MSSTPSVPESTDWPSATVSGCSWRRHPARPAPRRSTRSLPESRVVPLPDGVSFDVGAWLGVPAMTAHRALTIHEDGPARLGPGALDGFTVLVAGGAGAVGHAAIQLARWAGATVITTISSRREGSTGDCGRRAPRRELPRRGRRRRAIRVDRAGRRRHRRRGRRSRRTPRWSPTSLANHGVVSIYANNGGDEASLPIRPNMSVERPIPVPAALHDRRRGAVRGGRGRHRGAARRCAAGRRGRRAPAHPLRARADRRRRTTPSRGHGRQGAHRRDRGAVAATPAPAPAPARAPARAQQTTNGSHARVGAVRRGRCGRGQRPRRAAIAAVTRSRAAARSRSMLAAMTSRSS